MNMTFQGGKNATPVVDEDDPARSKLINVTVLRKTCIHTGNSIHRFMSGHRFSCGGETLGDHVVRTEVSVKTFLLLHVPSTREEVMKRILTSNP